jgi:3-hydroxyisobutyrate dehydrogenase
MITSIAFIGVGIMGEGLVKNLKKLGYTLNLFARNKDKILYLQDSKTKIISSIEEAVESSDLTIICLTEDTILEDAFFEKGILKNAKNTVLDFGTTSPKLTLRIHQALKEKDVNFIDSPMTGSKLAAQNGEIIFMIGAKEEECTHLKEIWLACGKKTIFCNSVSEGQKLKIVLNFVQAGLLQVYMEGFTLSKNLNIPIENYLEIIKNSAAKSPLSEFKLNAIQEKNFSTNFSLKNMNKDVNHAIELSNQTNSYLPLLSSLKPIYNLGMKKDLGELDFCSLININKLLNDIKD